MIHKSFNTNILSRSTMRRKQKKNQKNQNAFNTRSTSQRNIQQTTSKASTQLNWIKEEKKSVKQYIIANSRFECFQFFRGHRYSNLWSSKALSLSLFVLFWGKYFIFFVELPSTLTIISSAIFFREFLEEQIEAKKNK